MNNKQAHVIIKRIDLSDVKARREIISLQKLSYSQEAKIIGYEDIPARFDTEEVLLQSGERFSGCYVHTKLVGLISTSCDNQVLEICRLVVHPKFQRQNIATKLLDYLEEAEQVYTCIRVSTATKNEPAIALYRKNRFEEIERRRTPDGLELVTLKRSKTEIQ
ncbi:MAG TPA: GNAT family N-acetyltransferase [candidate division Zixibacteria bacterium]|nr:GNAT family N-acetyltransferase [candidate division Zixibacteria bacterium]